MGLNVAKGGAYGYPRTIACTLCGENTIATNGRQIYCNNCRCIAARKRATEYRKRNLGKTRERALEHYYANKKYYADKDKDRNNTPRKKYYIYKHSAKNRHLEFDLGFDEFMKYWVKPCFYCGGPINSIGIDRIDNNMGYVKGNIVSCCSVCNSMKSDKSFESFILFCRKISLNHTEVLDATQF